MYTKINVPINLGNPHEFTVLELAKMMIKLTDTESRIIFKPLPEDDPRQRQPDISHAKKMLRWSPKVQLKEGLKLTIDWLKHNS